MNEQITIVGNVSAEPVARRTTSGDAVAGLRVGVTPRRWDRGTSSWVDGDTNWYAVSAFRGLAENVLASVHKGDRVIVSGRFSLRAWDSGTARGTEAEINAEAIGHDLLFARTTATRAPTAVKDAPSPTGVSNGWTPADTEWAVVAPEEVISDVSGTSDPQVPLVPLVPSEVPF